jgi:transcriptional regulator NrdR family protein
MGAQAGTPRHSSRENGQGQAMKARWACKRCKRKFETMLGMKYHTCVPVKMERKKPVRKRPAERQADKE